MIELYPQVLMNLSECSVYPMPEASKFHGLYNPFLVKLKMFDYWIYYGVMNSPAQKKF
jgi:hypothetical protein